MNSQAGAPDQDEPAAAGGAPSDQQLEAIAWQVLSDLIRTGHEFGAYSPDGLQRLIELRLRREAKRVHAPLDALAAAFDRAMRELTHKPGNE